MIVNNVTVDDMALLKCGLLARVETVQYLVINAFLDNSQTKVTQSRITFARENDVKRRKIGLKLFGIAFDASIPIEHVEHAICRVRLFVLATQILVNAFVRRVKWVCVWPVC